MTRILVTGASGLLGLNLALEAAPEHQVLGLTHSHPLAAPFETRQLDLMDADACAALLDEFQPEWLIHCAALANLEACEQQPAWAARLNAGLPGALAAAAHSRGIRFLHISTDAVFDGEQGSYSEEDAPNPLSIYAETKLAGEQAVSMANPDALIVRTVFYGWSLSGRRSLAELFFNQLSAGETMPGHTDRIFSPLLVNDLAGILLAMLEQGLSGIYHAAGGESISKYEFGRTLAERFGLDAALIQPIKSTDAGLQARRAPDLSLNVDKLTTALGSELPDVHAGIERLHALHTQGYPAMLRAMSAATAPAEH